MQKQRVALRFSWLKLLVSLLVIASLVGACIIGYRAFSHKLPPIVGSISFIVISGLFIWFVVLLRRASLHYRKPSFALIFWSLVGITLICTFAGVQPLSASKDSLFNSISSGIHNAIVSSKSLPTSTPVIKSTPTPTQSPSIPYGTYTATVAGWIIGISGNVSESLTIKQDGTYIREDDPGGKEMGTYKVSSNYISLENPVTHTVTTLKYRYVDQFKCLYLYLLGENQDPLPFYRQ